MMDFNAQKIEIHIKSLVLIFSFMLCVALFGLYCVSQEGQDAAGCFTCHSEKFSLTSKYVHPLVREKKCKDCHAYYDEQIHVESVKPEIEVCERCHDQRELGRSHPVGGGIIDPNTNGSMTCVSTCHVVHGTDYKYMVPYRNNTELCKSCHRDM